MKLRTNILLVSLLAGAMAGSSADAADKLKALIIDGQNNHDWKGYTPVMKAALEESGRFVVEVSTTPGQAPGGPASLKADATAEQKAAHEAALAKWKERKAAHAEAWAKWRPKFADYNVIISNYNGDGWPEAVKVDFEKYLRNGGGLVVVRPAKLPAATMICARPSGTRFTW